STHLGNGMHNILPRHPNYLWSQLAEDDLYCSVIADGFHVPAEVLKVFMKIKKDKLFLVSDSTAFAGMAPGNFHTHIGGDVTLTGKGRLHLTANPATLAGSAVSMLDCVAFMVKEGLMTAAEAWMAGSVMPRKYLDQGKEPLGGNIHDDLVFFSLADGDCRLIG
ncbi:MAG: N-acetylglucosamine-6-phosphate deacetylase, partial [Cyclobacteriaceae bacterium]|nr:N-acetylglucosamine-6-phosphate deacetylase [Cyclobacteriaceae bacterium]